MIKIDEVIYRTRTQEEYDWLMEKLEAEGCKWVYGELPTKFDDWGEYSTETCIRLKDKIMDYADFNFYENESAYKDYEIMEVSDLMGDEEKTEILELEDYRIDFCSYVYELLQDDMDNTRANAIIDLYDELFEVAEHLERENSGTKMTANENDEKDEILDKFEDLLEDFKHIENEFKNLVEQEEETDTPEELEAIHKQVTAQITDLRKQGKEPNAIEYTIKVRFE